MVGESDCLRSLATARNEGRKSLDEPSAKALLAAFGLRVPASRVIRAESELKALERDLCPPYVLKVIAREVVHKSELGGVKVGLRTAEELARALRGMRASLEASNIRAEGWLVEEMVPSGVECVVGGLVDPEFGPMVMVGLGGIFVEILHDVAFRICPIERHDALGMIQELRGAPLLRGARGREAVSLEALADALLKLGGRNGVLMSCRNDVVEVDVNPLIVTRDTAVAVDARFILMPPEKAL